MQKKVPLYDDFYHWMPPELKEAVFQTETCRRFLFERTRIGNAIAQHIESGGNMNDECLKADIELLQSLTNALDMEIGNIKRRMYPDKKLE